MRKSNKAKIIFLLVAVAFSIITVVSIILCSLGKGDNAPEANEPFIQSFESGWKNQYGLSISIERLYQRVKNLNTNVPFYLTKEVPEDSDGMALFFRTNNLVVNIYLDGKPVSYISDNGSYYGLSSFQGYRFLRFSANDAGKEIKLEIFVTPFSSDYCIDSMKYGYAADLIKEKVADDIGTIIVSAVVFISGIIFIFIGISTIKVMENHLGLIFFGLFSVFMSLWFINGSIWANMFSGNLYAIDAGFWLYSALAAVFGLLYVHEAFKIIHAFLLKFVIFIWLALLAVMIVSMLIGFMNPGEFVYIQHSVLGISVAVVLIELISYLVYNNGNREKGKSLYFGAISFSFFVLYDICRFYQGSEGDYSAATRFGIVVMTVIISVLEMRQIIGLLALGIKAGKIGKIAYTDANTGIGNVAAFKEKMDSLEFTKTNYNYIGIIQFDVNNLKVVNDTKGHEAGDYLIKSAADVINRSFGTIGTCYRTGGDEFVAITTYNNAPNACQDAIIKFNSLINQFNENRSRPFDLRIAFGVAYYNSNENPYASLKDIHKVADERMYNNKKELKARYARTPEEAVIR